MKGAFPVHKARWETSFWHLQGQNEEQTKMI